MARDWGKMATEIVGLVGGEENINSLTHCVTRLRFKLKDESIVDDARVGQVEGVIQVIHGNGQYQVVIGNHVTEVYDKIGELTGVKLGGSAEADGEDAAPAGSKNPLSMLIETISSIFMPVIPAFASAGLMRAICTMLTSFGLMAETDTTYIILNTIGNGMFYFLPLFLAHSAAKRFKCSPYVAMAVAAFLCHPDITGLSSLVDDAGNAIAATFFGIPVELPSSGYTQTVIPIILATYLQSWVERGVKKIVPAMVRMIFVPLLTLAITSIITLLVVGPVANLLSNGIATVLLGLLNVAPLPAGLLIGGLWAVLLVFGLHWAFMPVTINNLMTVGFDPLMAITVGANFTIGCACLAIALKSRRGHIRQTGVEAGISSLVGGVAEPGLYGLVLKYKRPFVIICVANAVAGAIDAVLGLGWTAYMPTNAITLPAIYADAGLMQIVTIAIACAIAFAGTFAFGFSDSMVLEPEPDAE